MTRSRTWTLGAVGAVALILLAGWFLLISPVHTQTADAQLQAEDQLATNESLQNQLDLLKAQNKDLPKQEAELAEIRTHLPEAPGMPSLVRTLSKQASDTGVVIDSIVPEAVVEVAGVVDSTATVGADGTVTVDGGSTAQSGAGQAVDKAEDTKDTAEASQSAATEPSAPVAEVPVSALKAIPFTVTIHGGYFNVVRYLDRLEQLPRSTIVYGLNITTWADPDAEADDYTGISAQITGRVYYSPTVSPDAAATS